MAYYYSVTYNFSTIRNLIGPFSAEIDCWNAMQRAANKEFENDKLSGEPAYLYANDDRRYIEIETPSELDDSAFTTKYTMFENEEPKHIVHKDRIKKALQVLDDNGIDADEAETILQALGYVLLGSELFPEDD